MQSIIVADDMTGSNVSNSLLAKDGFEVGTVSDIDNLDSYDSYDVLGVHTDSRGLSSKDAYNKVFDYVSKLKINELKFFSKRIDSTLRGNNGTEIDAMLDALDDEEIAIVVPSFPSSGKIVIGNYMLVNGVPLEMTDVKNDPVSPVSSSRVASVLEEQTNKEIGTISMETILLGTDAIKNTIQALKENNVKIIIADACTNEDIESIANATIESGIKFISADPGPFTYYLVKKLESQRKIKNQQKLLFVVGTVSTIAISQIRRLRMDQDPYVVKINAKKLLYESTRDEEKVRVKNDVIKHLDDNEMFLIATMINSEDKLDLKAEAKKAGITKFEASETISNNIAHIGYLIANEMGDSLGGVYTSGGDITQAFLDYTHTDGIKIKNEIIPLAVYGTIMGGKLAGKSIVTKGGLIGDEYTLVECAEFLRTKIANQFYEENSNNYIEEAGEKNVI